jgi:DNA-binding NarL/FixJ family response regulator
MTDIAVVIADNQPPSLSGIRSAVADQGENRILAECESSEHLLNAVRHLCPDVVLVSEEILRKESEELGALEELVTEIDRRES